MSTIYTSDAFAKFKEDVLTRKIARKQISLSGLEFISEDVVKHGGVHFKMTKKAFTSLLKTLQISKGFRNSLIKSLGVNFVDKIIATITSRLEGNKNSAVIIVDVAKKTILNFLPDANAILSNQTYFDEVEKTIDRFNLDIINMRQDDRGGFVVDTTSKNSEWGLQNMPDDVI